MMEGFQPVWGRHAKRGEFRRLLGELVGQQDTEILRIAWDTTSQHTEQNAAQGIEIGAGIHLMSPHLLRRHIVQGPQDFTRASQLRNFKPIVVWHQFGDAKVEEFDWPGGIGGIKEKQVVGFDVAMNYAGLMSGFK